MGEESNETRLRDAVEKGDQDAVQVLLASGADVDEVLEKGKTPLYWASKGGHVGVMELLLEHGADVGRVTEKGKTALHAAVKSGEPSAVALLLERGLDVNATDEGGLSIAHEAAKSGNVEMLELLRKRGVDFHAVTNHGWTVLQCTLKEGHCDAATYLLKHGLSTETRDEDGWAALHFAAWGGNLECVKVLVDNGADVRAIANNRRTVLQVAAGGCSGKIVAFLLEHGVPVDEKDKGEWTALHYASVAGNVESMQLLIDWNADTSFVGKGGTTALHLASKYAGFDAVKTLLARSNNILDELDEDGWSALHFACHKGDRRTMNLLLDHGANPHIVTSKGVTLLHSAASKGLSRIVQLLLHRGLSANAVDENGWSIIHYAADGGNANTLRSILDGLKLDIDSRTKKGETALHLCARNGNVNMMRVLVAFGADVFAVTSSNKNLLHYAIESSKMDAFDYVLELGVDVNPRPMDGRINSISPLLLALRGPSETTSSRMSFALCSRGATLLHTERSVEAVMPPQSTTDNSVPSDNSVRNNDALWREGLHFCVLQWMREYPSLTKVPIEVILRGKLSVKTYLADAVRSKSCEALQRCKICIIGPSEWGKTSFVQSLRMCKPFLTLLKDRTIGIDLTTSILGDGEERVEVTYWDFAGQDIYRGAHTLFYSRRTLFVVVVDLLAYRRQLRLAESKNSVESEASLNRFVRDHIFRWVRSIFAHQPDAKFCIVGTKVNELEDPSHLNEIWDDFQDRLDRWKRKVAQGFEPRHYPSALNQPAKASKIQRENSRLLKGAMINGHDKQTETRHETNPSATDMKSKVDKLALREWLVPNIFVSETINTARQTICRTITSSDLGFPMWTKYQQVLDAIRLERETTISAATGLKRIGASIRRVRCLCGDLRERISDLSWDECEQILRTLHDLGDVMWYEHQNAGVLKDFVIIDPMLVIDVVREVIRHDFSSNNAGEWPLDGEISHGLLSSFPLWRDMDEEMKLAFKCLLQHFQLAYPADADSMLPTSNIIVPSYWSAERQGLNRSYVVQKSVCDNFNTHRWCWEYEIPGELSETIFEQFAVQSHSSLLPRTVRRGCVESSCDEFASRIVLIARDSVRDTILVEVSGVTAEHSWHNMRYYLMMLERVLENYQEDSAWRFLVHRSRDHSKDTRHHVDTVVRAINDAIVMGRNVESVRKSMPWMPPDMMWFVRKSWNDVTAIQQLHVNQLIQENMAVLTKLAIAGDAPRRYPALWSLQYVPDEQHVFLRMLSDLTGRCYHGPIKIGTGSPALARYASVFREGVSLLSTIVGSALSFSVMEKAIDSIKSGLISKVDQTERVHNLTKNVDLGTSLQFDSRGSQLSPWEATILLRDLLNVYNDSLDALEISEIAQLQLAVTSSGEYVWVHEHEISAMKGKLTPCASPPSTWSNFSPQSASSSKSTTPVSPTASLSSLSPSKKTEYEFSLVVESVVGLVDWDWHKVYCTWQLYYGDTSRVPIALGVTPTSADSSVPPSWRNMKTFVDSVDSVGMLRKCRLGVQVKRRSRMGWTKSIGEGEVFLRDFISEETKQNFDGSVSVPLSSSGSGTYSVVFILST